MSHANEISRWPLRAHCGKRVACKILRASRRGGELEEVVERMWLLLTLKLDPGNWRLLIPSPVLGRCILPAFPAPEPSQRHSPARAMCFWDHLGWIQNLTQLKPLYKPLTFCRAVPRSTRLATTRDKPQMWVPLFIKATSYESGVACLLLWSPLALHAWSQFQISPGELLRFKPACPYRLWSRFAFL